MKKRLQFAWKVVLFMVVFVFILTPLIYLTIAFGWIDWIVTGKNRLLELGVLIINRSMP